jgi:GNAT superfamily N-acetyltransferase
MTEGLKLTITPRSSLTGYDRIDIDLPDVRIGNVRCRFMNEKVIVYSIQVVPEFQRQGYGIATIDLLKSRFAVIVADRVRFTARGFWTKMGLSELPDGNWEYRRHGQEPLVGGKRSP